MVIAFVSLPCWTSSLWCLLVFSSLICLHKAQLHSFSPRILFTVSLGSLSAFSLSSHPGDLWGTAHQTKLKQTFSQNKKRPQLEQQHIYDIFADFSLCYQQNRFYFSAWNILVLCRFLCCCSPCQDSGGMLMPRWYKRHRAFASSVKLPINKIRVY